MDIPKHMINIKKSMQKIKIFNVKWTLKDKIYNNHIIFKLLKTIYIDRNFQCTSSINFSFDDVFLLLFILTLL
jgi:hypothetical protein